MLHIWFPSDSLRSASFGQSEVRLRPAQGEAKRRAGTTHADALTASQSTRPMVWLMELLVSHLLDPPRPVAGNAEHFDVDHELEARLAFEEIADRMRDEEQSVPDSP